MLISLELFSCLVVLQVLLGLMTHMSHHWIQRYMCPLRCHSIWFVRSFFLFPFSFAYPKFMFLLCLNSLKQKVDHQSILCTFLRNMKNSAYNDLQLAPEYIILSYWANMWSTTEWTEILFWSYRMNNWDEVEVYVFVFGLHLQTSVILWVEIWDVIKIKDFWHYGSIKSHIKSTMFTSQFSLSFKFDFCR